MNMDLQLKSQTENKGKHAVYSLFLAEEDEGKRHHVSILRCIWQTLKANSDSRVCIVKLSLVYCIFHLTQGSLAKQWLLFSNLFQLCQFYLSVYSIIHGFIAEYEGLEACFHKKCNTMTWCGRNTRKWCHVRERNGGEQCKDMIEEEKGEDKKCEQSSNLFTALVFLIPGDIGFS